MAERTRSMKSEQPSDLRNRQALLLEMAHRQIAAQIVEDLRETEAFRFQSTATGSFRSAQCRCATVFAATSACGSSGAMVFSTSVRKGLSVRQSPRHRFLAAFQHQFVEKRVFADERNTEQRGFKAHFIGSRVELDGDRRSVVSSARRSPDRWWAKLTETGITFLPTSCRHNRRNASAKHSIW